MAKDERVCADVASIPNTRLQSAKQSGAPAPGALIVFELAGDSANIGNVHPD
jgi:hypothetical protein